MPTSTYVIVAVVAYLLGSIPFGYILVRLFTGADVRSQGSGNIGATNVARTGRRELAVATLLLDAVKGTAAVLFGFAFGRHALNATEKSIAYATASGAQLGEIATFVQQKLFLVAAIAALLAIIGHMFPVWLRFKGGKGVATGLGVFIALAPKAVLVVLAVFVVILAITRYVSLGSVIASALFPFSFWWFHPDQTTPAVLALICGVSLLIVMKHKDNIRRLVTGTENRFGAKKA